MDVSLSFSDFFFFDEDDEAEELLFFVDDGAGGEGEREGEEEEGEEEGEGEREGDEESLVALTPLEVEMEVRDTPRDRFSDRLMTVSFILERKERKGEGRDSWEGVHGGGWWRESKRQIYRSSWFRFLSPRFRLFFCFVFVFVCFVEPS